MSATWDQSKFDAALGRYIQTSSRDMVTILNTKAYYIAAKASWYTRKAKPADIRAFMSKYVTVESGRRVNPKTGRMKKFKDYTFASSSSGKAPAIALIINSYRGANGKKGLYGKDMYKAMKGEQSRRMRSIAYIVSGWINAMRILEPNAEEKARARAARGVKLYPVPTGKAIPATESKMMVEIENWASSKWDKRGGFDAVASAGLQRAFDDEAKDMEKYMMRKQRDAEKAFNESK